MHVIIFVQLLYAMKIMGKILNLLFDTFHNTKYYHAHLPCMQAYSLCSFHPMHLLHKHLRTCIIQDHKPRTQSSYPRSPRSSSRCSRRKCPKPTRRTLRNFRSAPITVRAPSREASPGAFFSRFAII